MRIDNVKVYIAHKEEGLNSFKAKPPYLTGSLQEYYSIFGDYRWWNIHLCALKGWTTIENNYWMVKSIVVVSLKGWTPVQDN